MSGEAGAPRRIAAVLLAAGESRRMAGLDKRRLEIDGEALVLRWLRMLGAAGLDPVVLVLGHDAARIEALVAGRAARIVRNPHWAQGQQGSVLAGLAALPGGIDGALIALCDLPLVEPADLAWLCRRFAERPAGTAVIVPAHLGRRGNPVILAAEVVSEVLADPAGGGPRAWIDAHPQAVVRAEAGHDRFCFDLDTREDIARLEARLGRKVDCADSRPAPDG